MIKTFIYGTPLGFDLYEKSVEHLDFFKGFYISSRKGRRLMVNRKNNGETTYNYLRYGLQEAGGRPNSFFGMTIMIDGGLYCPNFKVMLEWFDYLFIKLVDERQLFKKNENGPLQYQVKKFEEDVNDVEWLKSNLPNILTQAKQTQLLQFDESFIDGKAGQIVSFRHDVNEARVLDTFKKYRWISVSSEIIDGDDNIVEPEEIELDFIELDKKLNEYNQTLLPIAVDINKGSKAFIEDIGKDVNEITSSIVTYLNKVTDKDLAATFKELDIKYVSLKQNIETLLDKMTVSNRETPSKLDLESKHDPEIQYCYSCKLNKPASAFRSPAATKCISCEQQEQEKRLPQTKTCDKCKKEKPIDQFSKKHPKICKDCDSQRPKPRTMPIVSNKSIKSIGTIAGILLLAGASIGVLKHCSSDIDKPKTENLATQPTAEVNAAAIDPAQLESLIALEDFSGIYEYINDKTNIYQYAPQLKEVIEKKLFNILDTELGTEKRKASIQEFYVDNQKLLDLINFNEEDKTTWEGVRIDYEYMLNILNKKQLSDAERKQGQEILNRHQDKFPKEWSERLAAIPTATTQKNVTKATTAQAEAEQNDNTPVSYKVKYTKASDGQTTTETFSKNRGIEALAGTTVTIQEIKGNTSRVIKTTTATENKEIITCDNKVQLTITGKKKLGLMEE